MAGLAPVVHRLPDSRLNGYTRFHLAPTEPSPPIKLYVDLSPDRPEALHRRWVILLEQPRARHRGQGRDFTLDEALALYARHGEHHTEHLTALRPRRGWTEPTAPAPA